jgi:hypothetical protein
MDSWMLEEDQGHRNYLVCLMKKGPLPPGRGCSAYKESFHGQGAGVLRSGRLNRACLEMGSMVGNCQRGIRSAASLGLVRRDRLDQLHFPRAERRIRVEHDQKMAWSLFMQKMLIG